MPDLILNSQRYSYRFWGSGRPLLLLHGFTGSSASWEETARAWPPGTQLIAPDLLGHGASTVPSDPGRYAMPAVEDDLLFLLDHLDLSQVDLLGYSMGGRLALYFALRHPERVRRLVLESASPGLETQSERLARRQSDEALAQRIEAFGIQAFVEEWERLPIFASQQELPLPVRQAQRLQRLANHPEGLANCLRGMGTGAQPGLWGELPNLTLPVLLLVGALDTKFQEINQRMASLLPNALLHTLPRTGHTPHLESPSVYIHIITRFLDVQ